MTATRSRIVAVGIVLAALCACKSEQNKRSEGPCTASAEDCCVTDDDCASLAAPSICTDTATCQGERSDVSCNQTTHRCDVVETPDDSGCATTTVGCGLYRDYACSNAVDQPAPVCLTSCGSDGDANVPDASKCAAGALCLQGPTGLTCQPELGVGDCCKDPENCPLGACTPDTLHCGDAQSQPVFLCCALDKTCCSSDLDCSSTIPGMACNLGLSECYDSCATNDDTKCAADYHCQGSTCEGDFDDGDECTRNAQCKSGNCSEDYTNGSTRYCTPTGECADHEAGESYAVGYILCTGDTSYRACAAAGDWADAVTNPALTARLCEAVAGVYNSGYQAALTCSSGMGGGDEPAAGFVGPGCVNCDPYTASLSGCFTDCLNGWSAVCQLPYWCDYNGSTWTCIADLENETACGNTFDPDAECQSGACIPNPGSDSTCQDLLPDGVLCVSDAHCQSRNCVVALNSSARYCTPAGQCPILVSGSDLEYHNAGEKSCDESNDNAAICMNPVAGKGEWSIENCYASVDCVTMNGCEEGACNVTPTNEGGDCNDGNDCTGSDVCASGVCTGNSASRDGQGCEDGNECTGSDVCASGVCTGDSSSRDGQGCNDGNECTASDQCSAGVCSGESASLEGSVCYITGCVYGTCHEGACD